MTPQTDNAYYARRPTNLFPAAILQPPYFDPAADPAANYGAIGATIGHEMSHAFDDQGRKSDAHGKLRDWWTRPTPSAMSGGRQARRAIQRYEPLPGHPHQRRTDARGEHRRSRGPAHRIRRVQAVARRQRGAGDRRPHRRSALLPRLRGELEKDLPARDRAQSCCSPTSTARRISGQRDRPEHGRVVCRVRREEGERSTSSPRTACGSGSRGLPARRRTPARSPRGRPMQPPRTRPGSR